MKLKDLNAIIEKNNTAFELMSQAEKRVAIAEDCIVRVKLEQIKARQGSFICQMDFYGGFDGYGDDGEIMKPKYMAEHDNDVKEIINSTPISCSACAKGALFLSYVGRVNNVNRIYDSVDAHDSEHQKLMELFSIHQLALIELAFEGHQYITWYNGERISFDYQVEESAMEVYKLTEDANDRLTIICENIIENKGEFIPATSLKL